MHNTQPHLNQQPAHQTSSLSFLRPLNREGQSEPRCSYPDSLLNSGWSVVCVFVCGVYVWEEET